MTIAEVQVNGSGDDLPTRSMVIIIFYISYICEQIHSHGPDKILPFKCNRVIIPIHRPAFVRCLTIGLASIMSPKWSTFIRINDRRMGKWNPNFHQIAQHFRPVRAINRMNMHFAGERSVISPHLFKTNKRTSDVRRLISKCDVIYTQFIWFVIMQWRMFYDDRYTQRVNRARNVRVAAMTSIQDFVVNRKL